MSELEQEMKMEVEKIGETLRSRPLDSRLPEGHIEALMVQLGEDLMHNRVDPVARLHAFAGTEDERKRRLEAGRAAGPRFSG